MAAADSLLYVSSAANDYVQEFSMGLKNGYYQLIDCFKFDYNNKNIIRLQPFTNFCVNYKIMSSYSAGYLKKWGPTIGFNADSAGSSSYVAAANENGEV